MCQTHNTNIKITELPTEHTCHPHLGKLWFHNNCVSFRFGLHQQNLNHLMSQSYLCQLVDLCSTRGQLSVTTSQEDVQEASRVSIRRLFLVIKKGILTSEIKLSQQNMKYQVQIFYNPIINKVKVLPNYFSGVFNTAPNFFDLSL